MSIFISYSREDTETASKLLHGLRSHGFECWFDRENLVPGSNWKYEIEQAISSCSFFLALISNASLKKNGFVQKEIRLALDVLDHLPLSSIFVIPVRIDDCQPEHPAIRDRHWVDLFPSYEEGLNKLIQLFQSPRTDADTGFSRGQILNRGAVNLESARASRKLESIGIEPFDRFFRTLFDFLVHRPANFFCRRDADPDRYTRAFTFGIICIVANSAMRDSTRRIMASSYGPDGPLSWLVSAGLEVGWYTRIPFVIGGYLLAIALLTLAVRLALRILGEKVQIEDIVTGLAFSQAASLPIACCFILLVGFLYSSNWIMPQADRDAIVIIHAAGSSALDLLFGGAYVVASLAAVCKVPLPRMFLATMIALSIFVVVSIPLGFGLAILIDVIS